LPFKFTRVSQIPELVVIEPIVFEDKRGFFMETYSYREFERFGIPEKFVQDNHSKSIKGVLRTSLSSGTICSIKACQMYKGRNF